MEYVEYKKILDQAMIDYNNRGGSLLYMSDVIHEYVFDYDNDNISYEERKHLDDRAVKAIAEKKRLPEGIRLKQCIWHRRDVGNE